VGSYDVVHLFLGHMDFKYEIHTFAPLNQDGRICQRNIENLRSFSLNNIRNFWPLMRIFCMLIAFQQTHQMFAKIWLAKERLELAFSLKELDHTLLTRDDDLQRECVL
jgi:hypothetical protein